MVNEVVVCGDSFACGIGLPFNSCFENSFGGLVAKHYNVPHTVYARSGCCNYVIYLQVKKVIEDYKYKTKPFVLITITDHSRSAFPSDHAGQGYNNYTLEDVEYTNYEPYSGRESGIKRPLPFTPKQKPKLISETVSNILYYFSGKAPNLEYLFVNVKNKFSAIKTFYEELYDDSIKQSYDTGLILMMNAMLKEANIPHLIMTPNEHNDRFVNKENYFYNNWGHYSQKYPDAVGSGHCNEKGHKEVAEKLIKRIENYK
jgi:hypothetical protein